MWLAAVLGVLLVLAYAPYVFGGRSLMSSSRDIPSLFDSGAQPPETAEPDAHVHVLDAPAAGWQTEPWLAIQHRIVADGRWPWWDPYDGYGQPFDAAMQPQPFFPLTAALALAPSPAAYTAWVLARLFLAGWFGALFLRLFADRVAAAGAGIATMFSGYYLLNYNIPHLSVETLLPMLLWATELVVRRPRAPERIAALALAAGLTYLGGMPESALLALVTAGLYGLARVAMPSRSLRSSGTIVAAHLIGLTIGAVCLIPFAAYVGASFNVHDPAKNHGAIMGLTFDVDWRQGVLTELVPRAFGPPWGSMLHGGSGDTGVRGFIGCVAGCFALIGIFAALRHRKSAAAMPVWFFTLIAAFFILKRFGDPLVGWAGALPLFNLIEFPKYGENVIGVSVALLAGFGIAALRRREAGIRMVLAAGAVTLCALAALTLDLIPQLPAGPLQGPFWVALAQAAIALLVAGTAAAIFAVDTGERRRALALCAVLVAFAAEPFVGYVQPTMWSDAPSNADDPYAGAPYLAWLGAHVDRERERIVSVGARPNPNWSGAYGFADPRTINALFPARYLRFVYAFLQVPPVPQLSTIDPAAFATPLGERWLELSSIAWVTASRPFGSGRPAFSDADTVIYHVPHVLARVTLFHRVRRSADFAHTLALLTAPDFDVYREAVVEGATAALGPAAPDDRVRVVASHSDDITADVATTAAALLMQNDTWFPGWTARIDGRAAPLLRVDGLFRGVVVPGGRHTVEIRYRDRATEAGLAISAAGLVVLIGLAAAGCRGSRALRLRRGPPV